jgi:hypothetical protein
MRIVRCDRCGNDIPQGETWSQLELRMMTGSLLRELDMCIPCSKDLQRYLKDDQKP